MTEPLPQEELQEFWNRHLPEEADHFPAVWDFFFALWEENTRVNLFSRKLTPDLVFQDQIVDCALGLSFFDTSARVLDFGCGGGLPGAVLAACRPLKEFVLLDKSPKKIHHLKQICQRAGIENVKLSSEPNPHVFEGVDTITSRAVAPASKLIRLIEPNFKNKDHTYLLYKARMENIMEELKVIPGHFSSEIHPIEFPNGARERHMVELRPV